MPSFLQICIFLVIWRLHSNISLHHLRGPKFSVSLFPEKTVESYIQKTFYIYVQLDLQHWHLQQQGSRQPMQAKLFKSNWILFMKLGNERNTWVMLKIYLLSSYWLKHRAGRAHIELNKTKSLFDCWKTIEGKACESYDFNFRVLSDLLA